MYQDDWMFHLGSPRQVDDFRSRSTMPANPGADVKGRYDVTVSG
jgi:hypothetical protein